MSQDFGNGVSRTLSAFARQFQAVVFQQGRPPLDSEVNLVQQDQVEQFAQLVRAEAHSGFFLDPTRALDDFVTDRQNSNMFLLGQQKKDDDGNPEELAPVLYANVNGWVIPVTGTYLTTEGSTSNEVRLNPPPTSETRIDFIFLEAWQALVAPNPSTINKPSASTVWKYGNVEFGATNLTDDIKDPTMGHETTERVQLQYRIRVVGSGSGAGTSPSLDVYPDGLGDPNVFAQGPQSAVTSFTFENMREALGDPSLWRAGDGDAQNALGTVDGYTYAVPICAVFRRNSQPYVAVNQAGAPNQNGGFDRNPSAISLPDPRDGAKVFATMSLIDDLGPEQFTVDATVQVDGAIGSGWDDPSMNLATAFLVIDDEVIGISAINTTTSPATITIPAGGRGRWGSDIVTHTGRSDPSVVGTGTAIQFFNTRPSDDGPVAPGPYSDEVREEDFLDLRRGVNLGDWDYGRLLLHSVSALMRNRLRSTWKQAGAPGGDTEGVTVTEVDYLLQDGGTAVPYGTEALDGPDGIRQVWSDAAALQGDVTVMLDPDGTINAGFIATMDDLVEWDVGADFKPRGFMNNADNTVPGPGFTNGTTVFVYLGGDSGNEGARKTFRDGSTRAVRFVSPQEYWKTQYPDENTGLQNPVTLLWVSSDQANVSPPTAGPGGGLQSLTPAGPGETASEHPGPMYPLQFLDFEKPFLVCGGVLNTASVVTGVISASQLIGNSLDPTIPLGEGEIVLAGIDFDVAGDWWSKDTNGNFEDDPTLLNFPVIRGERTLWSLLTNEGADVTGASSEVYLILFGDNEKTPNNGAFKIVGAGTTTSGLTTNPASASNRVRVQFLSQGVTDFDNTSTKTVTAEMRSQATNSEDGGGYATGPAALTVTMTDLTAATGGGSNPWSADNINPGGTLGKTLQLPFDYKAVLNLTLLYHPGRGGMARVPDEIQRITIQNPESRILRQSRAVLDPTFPTATGAPSNPAEVDYNPTHIQTWNRLPSLGLPSPDAPNYGGNVVLSSEIDRENESFFDRGSKTLLFRPFQRQAMTFKGFTTEVPDTLFGSSSYPNPSLIPNGWDGPKDDAQIFTVGLKMGYPVPQQHMPRFGRYDIPYYQDNGPTFGAATFLEGIGHEFCDGTDLSSPTFDVIGGEDNQTGGTQVTPMYLQTGSTSGFKYGQFGTITGTLKPGYQGRLTTEIGDVCSSAAEITQKLAEVVSSDFGAGLVGIQLPPYLGIARVYGVYDRRDFVAKGGQTFQADRVTPEAAPAINLMRRDLDRQTLFICEDGAYDLTGERGDHTYILPFNMLDITKSPNYVAGEAPADLEYVVEFTCFGFARGFINENNFVMARRHNGQGTLRQDGDNPELEGVEMCIPSASPDSSRVYVNHERTVYQGDPYMSRNGATRTTSDYEDRYGQVSQSDAYQLNFPIQQFAADGSQIPTRPNARSFQVLAAMDFYTTMGSGNVGGRLYPGTVTDVGFVENRDPAATRIPLTVDTPAWRVLTRAFTAGQAKTNTSRGQAVLEITGTNATFNFLSSAFTVRRPDGVLITFTAVNGPTGNDDEFDASSPDPAVIARELFTKINNRTELLSTVAAYNDIDSPQIEIVAFEVGAGGTNVTVMINDVDNFLLKVPTTGQQGLSAQLTTTALIGGLDQALNAGDGTTQLVLSGMTERMPLGILMQDSDFIGENPLSDKASAVKTEFGGIRPAQILLPLTRAAGEEFTRFSGAPGEVLAASDGGILQYTAYNATTAPGGSTEFRLFRGGGSSFVLGGRNPGGPVDWFSDSLAPALTPVLKGGMLACKAILVRNLVEKAFSTEDVTTDGDEIQMLLVTNGVLGDQDTAQSGVTVAGIVGPTGFGEGTAAADRYRINGKPMFVGRMRTTPDPETVSMAPFPGRDQVDLG